MKRQIVVTNQFRKDYKQAMKRGLKIDLLDDVIRICHKVSFRRDSILLASNAKGTDHVNGRCPLRCWLVCS